MSGLKIVFGGATINDGFAFAEPTALYKTLKEVGVDTIDTATLYGSSMCCFATYSALS